MTNTEQDRIRAGMEANKKVARRWMRLISEHAIEEMCAMTADDWTMHGGPPNLPKGTEGVRALFRAIGPVQQTWDIDDVIAEGDKVVIRATNTCTQDSFFGVPAKGRTQVFSAMFILKIRDGIVQETWRNADDLGRLFQLGARIEPPA